MLLLRGSDIETWISDVQLKRTDVVAFPSTFWQMIIGTVIGTAIQQMRYFHGY